MTINKLYNIEAIKRDFSLGKLLSILLDDEVYPIRKQKLVFEKSEMFYMENEEDSYVFAIEKGISSVFIGNQLVNFVGAGEFIGLHCEGSTDETRFSGSVISDEVVVWRFHFHDVLAKIMNIQEGYLYHYNYMISIYPIYLNKILAMGADVEERVFGFLEIIAGKFGEIDGPFVKIPSFFTRKLLSDYINVSRMTLNTTIKRLEEKELIKLDDRLICVRMPIS